MGDQVPIQATLLLDLQVLGNTDLATELAVQHEGPGVELCLDNAMRTNDYLMGGNGDLTFHVAIDPNVLSRLDFALECYGSADPRNRGGSCCGNVRSRRSRYGLKSRTGLLPA